MAWWPEHIRPDPSGGVVAPDRPAAGRSPRITTLNASRGGWASAQIVVTLPRPQPYQISVAIADRSGKIALTLYREWFHFTEWDKSYYPDALIPIPLQYSSQMPEPDAGNPNQRAAAFWLDIWIPIDTPAGAYVVTAALAAGAGGGGRASLRLNVAESVIPADDPVIIDHNSYGSSWLAEQYPKLSRQYGDDFFTSDDFFRLVQAYHRIFYEHRGTFHQLGYGHAGKVAPEFAPVLAGSGRSKRIIDWSLYDRHYGALLDGSAFRNTRRGPKPIPFVYLPVNPEWPASFLWWGEAGYEAEFVNVLSEMEKHFREKGWTSTRFEVFFNHKKRYRGFPWDGDEVRFAEDNEYLREYARLMKKAIPAASPVRFVLRTDASWSLEQQFRDLAGVVNMWVCSGGILSWLKEEAAKARSRGEIVWHYSGPPPVTQPASAITRPVLRTWVWGIDGYIHWLTVNAGADPWFKFDGGGTALVYPGDLFGQREPMPSIRLKIQRNCVQDIALLQSRKVNRAEVTMAYNSTQPSEWWSERPGIAARPPHEWTNPDIDDAVKAVEDKLRSADAAAWERVRQLLYAGAGRRTK